MNKAYPASRWDTLIRVCAAVSATVEIVRGIAVFDRESIAIGVILLAFTAFHVWIGIGALFVNQAFWMIGAVVALTRAAPSTVGAAIPSVLATLAIAGLVASVARWRTVTDRRADVLGGLAVMLAIVLAIAVPIAGRDAVAVHPGDLRISARNVKFSTTRLSAHAGDIAVVFTNKDLFWHTFTVGKFNVNVRVATSGRGRVVMRDVPAGTYSFVCAIPGHESAGMKGELVVT